MTLETILGALGAWLATYFLHSTLVIALAWVTTRPQQAARTRDWVWKLALVGPIATATVAVALPGDWGWLAGPRASRMDRETPLEVHPVSEAAGAANPPLIAVPEQGGARSGAAALGPALNLEGPMDEAAGGRRGGAIAAVDSSLTESAFPKDRASSRGAGWIRRNATLPMTARPALAVGWFLIAALACVRLRARQRAFAAALSDRQPVSMGPLRAAFDKLNGSRRLRADVLLSKSSSILSPIALGPFRWLGTGRQEVCAPERAERELDAGELEALMAHELAHLERRDPAWLSLAIVLEHVLWFQPLVGLARRELSRSMEECADQCALGRIENPLHLAHCLARVAEWVDGRHGSELAPGMARRPSDLVHRMERVLAGAEEPKMKARLGRTAGGIVSGAALLLLASAGPRVVASQEAVAPENLSRKATPIDGQAAEVLAALGYGAVGGAVAEAPAEPGNPLTVDAPAPGANDAWAELQSALVDAAREAGLPLHASRAFQDIDTYSVRVGDSIRIVDNLHSVLTCTEEVSGLGTILVPELGVLRVTGLTQAELQARVEEQAQSYFADVSLHLQVLPLLQTVLVCGAVEQAGHRALTDDTTLLEAVSLAKPKGADLGRVKLIRPDPVNPLVLHANVAEMQITGDTSANVLLSPGDVLFVPRMGKTAQGAGGSAAGGATSQHDASMGRHATLERKIARFLDGLDEAARPSLARRGSPEAAATLERRAQLARKLEAYLVARSNLASDPDAPEDLDNLAPTWELRHWIFEAKRGGTLFMDLDMQIGVRPESVVEHVDYGFQLRVRLLEEGQRLPPGSKDPWNGLGRSTVDDSRRLEYVLSWLDPSGPSGVRQARISTELDKVLEVVIGLCGDTKSQAVALFTRPGVLFRDVRDVLDALFVTEWEQQTLETPGRQPVPEAQAKERSQPADSNRNSGQNAGGER